VIENLSWWAFLGLVPVAYWLLPARFRAGALALASLGFLFSVSPVTVAFMLGLALLVFYGLELSPMPAAAGNGPGLSILPEKIGNARLSTWLFFAVLAYLIWYKYTPQVMPSLFGKSSIAQIVIPLGLSYYSFKLMHYALERGRGTLPPHNVQEFVTWMFLMPTFSSGPIERFDHFESMRETEFRMEFVIEGLTRIVQGLVKRFVLVDQLGSVLQYLSGSDLVGFAHGLDGQPGIWVVWAYLFLGLVNLYLDFSAYSDIAIGASRLFGFKIIENFRYPLLASSLGDFWSRWHISLTSWCRAYVYMPVIGMTRSPYAATIATFALVGLWHAGSTLWLAWGLWHGIGLSLALRWSRFAQKKKIKFFKTQWGKVAGWALTMLFASLGGAFDTYYNVGGVADAFHLMGRAFGL